MRIKSISLRRRDENQSARANHDSQSQGGSRLAEEVESSGTSPQICHDSDKSALSALCNTLGAAAYQIISFAVKGKFRIQPHLSQKSKVTAAQCLSTRRPECSRVFLGEIIGRFQRNLCPRFCFAVQEKEFNERWSNAELYVVAFKRAAMEGTQNWCLFWPGHRV